MRVIKRYLLPNASIRVIRINENHYELTTHIESKVVGRRMFNNEKEALKKFDKITSAITPEVHKILTVMLNVKRIFIG